MIRKFIMLFYTLVSVLLLSVLSVDICYDFPGIRICGRIREHLGLAPVTNRFRRISLRDMYCALGCRQEGFEQLETMCRCTELFIAQEPFNILPEELEEDDPFPEEEAEEEKESTEAATTEPNGPNPSEVIDTPPAAVETSAVSMKSGATPDSPGYCYYSSNQQARTDTGFAMLDALLECQYPGVVGIFRNSGVRCMGILLNEDTILTNSECNQLVQSFHMQVRLRGTLDTSRSPQTIMEIDRSSAANLDQSDSSLITLTLTSPVTFDGRCVRPACVPNTRISVDDIDFGDCRLVGYHSSESGTGTAISFGADSGQRFSHVQVSVEESSVSQTTLRVRRTSVSTSEPCSTDFASPVFCRLQTNEWVTVGLSRDITHPCETESSRILDFEVENLLREAAPSGTYTSLQRFGYASLQ